MNNPQLAYLEITAIAYNIIATLVQYVLNQQTWHKQDGSDYNEVSKCIELLKLMQEDNFTAECFKYMKNEYDQASNCNKMLGDYDKSGWTYSIGELKKMLEEHSDSLQKAAICFVEFLEKTPEN